jgi:hypothetical protein
LLATINIHSNLTAENHRRTVAGSAGQFAILDPHDRSFYTIQDGHSARWTPGGKPLWDYRVVSSLGASLSQPIARPGQVWGVTKPLGVAGEFTGLATYFGNFHLFTRDGLYVARLFKDGRLAEMGPEVLNAETVSRRLQRSRYAPAGDRGLGAAAGLGRAAGRGLPVWECNGEPVRPAGLLVKRWPDGRNHRRRAE